MPRLSYPGGRQAAARVEQPKESSLKSNSVRMSDSTGLNLADMVEEEDNTVQPEVNDIPADDASIAFQKQIEDLRKAEQVQRERNEQLVQERQNAINRANERDAEISRLKKTGSEARLESISNALVAAQAEAEAAQGDIEKASELGDHKGLAEAYKRLSRAEVNAANMENGKAELEEQIKTETTTREQPNPMDRFPPLARNWIDRHQYILNDQRKFAKLNSLHWDAIDAGHDEYTQPYLDYIEIGLGLREPPMTRVDEEDDEPPQRNRSMVSAPVSREAPANSQGERPGRVTLSLAQKEAAKIAGIDEKTYAENLLKLRQEKMNGNYGGQA